MFNVGEKIKIIYSNDKRKGAKVRRGSIGYISTLSHPINISDKHNYIMVLASVIFNQFGINDKKRIERKKVILINPLRIQKYTTINTQKKFLINLMKLTRDSKSDIQLKLLNSGIIYKKNYPCVIALSSFNNLTISDEESEFMCWMYSILQSNVIQKFKNLHFHKHSPKNKTYTNLLNNVSIIKDLIKYQLIGDIKNVNNLLKTIFKDKNLRNLVILRFKSLLCLELMKSYEELYKINRKINLFHYGRLYNVYIKLYNSGIDLTKIKPLYQEKIVINAVIRWQNIFKKIESNL